MVLQAEDEISGIGAAVGASFAGKKSMTATSGPGMSLKTEVLGLASIAELPLVLLNVQRGGPSTGMPTKPEQADLFQAAFCAHGDVLRPVLAPTSAEDTFGSPSRPSTWPSSTRPRSSSSPTRRSPSARRRSIPSTSPGSRSWSGSARPRAARGRVPALRSDADSGVSPLSHPGMQGGNYLAAGIEHNVRGAPTASGAIHAAMNEKRFRKLAPLLERTDLFERQGH